MSSHCHRARLASCPWLRRGAWASSHPAYVAHLLSCLTYTKSLALPPRLTMLCCGTRCVSTIVLDLFLPCLGYIAVLALGCSSQWKQYIEMPLLNLGWEVQFHTFTYCKKIPKMILVPQSFFSESFYNGPFLFEFQMTTWTISRTLNRGDKKIGCLRWSSRKL